MLTVVDFVNNFIYKITVKVELKSRGSSQLDISPPLTCRLSEGSPLSIGPVIAITVNFKSEYFNIAGKVSGNRATFYLNRILNFGKVKNLFITVEQMFQH